MAKTLTRRRFAWLAAVAAGSAALGGCAAEGGEGASASTASDPKDDAQTPNANQGEASNAPEAAAEPEPEPAPDPAAEARAAVEARMQEMSLQQKVAQLFVVAPEALALAPEVSPVTQAAEIAPETLATYPVGGVIFFAANLIDPDQTTTLLADLQQQYAQSGNVAPLIGVDEEGGTVTRVARNEAFAIQDVGNASDIGVAGDARAAKQAAEHIAEYLMPLGFNLDFAPVADVVNPLRSDTMGLRSFSSDATVAAEMVRAEVEGFRAKNLMSCAKHFPGIGVAAGDSHDGSITIGQTLEELRAVDLVPFEAAIEAEVPMIMVGHVSVPNVAGNETPASLNPALVQSLLRETLAFEGVVVTDSLSMGAVTNYYTPGQAAVLALQAGCDIALMPENFVEAYQGVLDAVTAGELSEARIDESVFRILSAKLHYFNSL